jgi:hypothetical protein
MQSMLCLRLCTYAHAMQARFLTAETCEVIGAVLGACCALGG